MSLGSPDYGANVMGEVDGVPWTGVKAVQRCFKARRMLLGNQAIDVIGMGLAVPYRGVPMAVLGMYLSRMPLALQVADVEAMVGARDAP